jgi:hypothetical protein
MALEKVYETYAGTSDNAKFLFDSIPVIISQTITIGTTGDDENFIPTKVRIYGQKEGSPTGSVIVEIRSTSAGTPTQTILCKGTFDITSLLATDSWAECTLDSTSELSAATQYAITLRVDTDFTPHDGSNDMEWRGHGSGTAAYAGGAKSQSSDGGVTWVAGTAADQMFQVIGNVWSGTLASYNDVIGKTGVNVASALGKGAAMDLLNRFTLQAESTLNTVTRYNWHDAYSALNADVKYVINDVVSSMVAINAIAYDMSGYTDRVEAEDMINIQRDNVLRGLGILRDKKQQTFIIGA